MLQNDMQHTVELNATVNRRFLIALCCTAKLILLKSLDKNGNLWYNIAYIGCVLQLFLSRVRALFIVYCYIVIYIIVEIFRYATVLQPREHRHS